MPRIRNLTEIVRHEGDSASGAAEVVRECRAYDVLSDLRHRRELASTALITKGGCAGDRGEFLGCADYR